MAMQVTFILFRQKILRTGFIFFDFADIDDQTWTIFVPSWGRGHLFNAIIIFNITHFLLIWYLRLKLQLVFLALCCVVVCVFFWKPVRIELELFNTNISCLRRKKLIYLVIFNNWNLNHNLRGLLSMIANLAN